MLGGSSPPSHTHTHTNLSERSSLCIGILDIYFLKHYLAHPTAYSFDTVGAVAENNE